MNSVVETLNAVYRADARGEEDSDFSGTDVTSRAGLFGFTYLGGPPVVLKGWICSFNYFCNVKLQQEV